MDIFPFINKMIGLTARIVPIVMALCLAGGLIFLVVQAGREEAILKAELTNSATNMLAKQAKLDEEKFQDIAVGRGHAVYKFNASGTKTFEWLPPCNQSIQILLTPPIFSAEMGSETILFSDASPGRKIKHEN